MVAGSAQGGGILRLSISEKVSMTEVAAMVGTGIVIVLRFADEAHVKVHLNLDGCFGLRDVRRGGCWICS
jgi:hypothetical protein